MIKKITKHKITKNLNTIEKEVKNLSREDRYLIAEKLLRSAGKISPPSWEAFAIKMFLLGARPYGWVKGDCSVLRGDYAHVQKDHAYGSLKTMSPYDKTVCACFFFNVNATLSFEKVPESFVGWGKVTNRYVGFYQKNVKIQDLSGIAEEVESAYSSTIDQVRKKLGIV